MINLKPLKFSAVLRGALLLLGLVCTAQLNAAAAIHIAIVDPIIKVRPNFNFIASPTPELQVAAARGEIESAQLALWSDTAVDGVQLRLSPMRAEGGSLFPAADTRVLMAHYVEVKRPSDARGQAGEWPDPLIPVTADVKLKAGRKQGFWISFSVGVDTPAGRYSGNLDILQRNQLVKSVPVTLQVWPVNLPNKPTLPTLVGFDYEMIARFDGISPNPATVDKALFPYYRMLRRNHAYPLFIYEAKPGYKDDGKKVELDMVPFWRKVELALEDDAKTAPIGIPFSEIWPVDTRKYPFGSAEFRARTLRYLRAIAAELQGRHALERSFLYVAATDEPKTAAQVQLTRQLADLIREADPRLQLLQTVHAHCEDCQGGTLAQQDHPSFMWAPNIAYYDAKAMRAPKLLSGAKAMNSGWTPDLTRQLRNKKRQIWWYLNSWTFLLSDPPAYPNLFVDHQGIAQRVTGWLAFRDGVSGVGHWNATYWRNVDNPWASLPHGENNAGTAGDGILVYPGKGVKAVSGQAEPNGPVSSIRLELLRDGAEDHALLTLLKQKDPQLVQSILAPLLRSLSDYEHNPEAYRQARQKIAQALSAPANHGKAP